MEMRTLDRLGDEIAELSAHLDAATARLLDLIREFDAREGWNTGFRSCAAWLSWRVGLDVGAARERVRVARALGTLTRLTYLNLESTRCTDNDVAVLMPLVNLTDLDLGYNPGISDAGLRNLVGLRKLAGLRLYETKVTDQGVAELFQRFLFLQSFGRVQFQHGVLPCIVM